MRAFAWPMWPLRPIVLAILVIFALMPTYAEQAPTLLQLGADPYITTEANHHTAVEPDSFSYGPMIVATFQVGRFSSSGAVNIGWASSRDSGNTWSRGMLPGIVKLAGGSYDRATDPSVGYDAADGIWLISTLALMTSTTPATRAIMVSRSADRGLTWSSPFTVTVGSSLDKNWLVCDNSPISPYYGNCYMQWSASNSIFMSTSTDGGLNWAAPVVPAGTSYGLGGQPLVQPNGIVIVPFDDFGIEAFRSTNGGLSWSNAVVVASGVQRHRPQGMRFFGLPSAEIDAAGKVYVVWEDCRFRVGCTANDLVMSTSTDGLIWSPVTRIPINGQCHNRDLFIPGLAVDQTTAGSRAKLALTFYYYPEASCSTETCRLSVGFVSSDNGGTSWSKPTKLAGPMQLDWLPLAGGRMVGDYISTSFVRGKAFPVFSAAGPPQGGRFNQAIYTAIGELNQLPELPGGCVYLPIVHT